MNTRKTRIIGALALACLASIAIQGGPVDPSLLLPFVILMGAVLLCRIRQNWLWDRIQRESAVMASLWDVRQNWMGDWLVIDRKQGIVSLFSGRRTTDQAQAPPIAGPVEPGQDTRTLADVLSAVNRCLIVGGMGSGKSELLKHLADHHERAGADTVIIDSHAAPWSWPVGRVVGMGRDYAAIETEIRAICTEMDRRYQRRSQGVQRDFPPLAVIIDEATVLHQFADLQAEMKSLLCECRKVGIKLVVAGQSDRAGALGLTGNNDLRAGFEAVVYLEKTPTGIYQGRVFRGSSKEAEIFPHPGPFKTRHGVAPDMHQTPHQAPPNDHHDDYDGRDTVTPCLIPEVIDAEAPAPSAFYESRTARQICEMYRAGHSLNDIARAVWGSSNGRRTASIKTILTDYGLL